MFGCGLPVAAKSCPALHELVINGINGMIFETAAELAQQVGPGPMLYICPYEINIFGLVGALVAWSGS
jgi:hypothetical protein